jgi:hypothetical protein
MVLIDTQGGTVVAEWIVLALVALAASTVAAVIGCGAAAVLLPALVTAFGVRQAIPILTVAQLIGNGARVWFNRCEVDLPMVGWFALGGVPMALVGGYTRSSGRVCRAVTSATIPSATVLIRSGHEPDVAAARQSRQQVRLSMRELRAVASPGGAYVSESDFFETDWQHAYCGGHYELLPRIKKRYDPNGLFYVHNGMGRGMEPGWVHEVVRKRQSAPWNCNQRSPDQYHTTEPFSTKMSLIPS